MFVLKWVSKYGYDIVDSAVNNELLSAMRDLVEDDIADSPSGRSLARELGAIRLHLRQIRGHIIHDSATTSGSLHLRMHPEDMEIVFPENVVIAQFPPPECTNGWFAHVCT